MRHFTSKLLALVISALPLFADSVTVDWNQVCRKAGDYDLIATTSSGDTVTGYCVGVTVNDISIQTPDHRIVKVARDKISELITRRRKDHQLRSLAKDMHAGFRDGFRMLFTHDAIIGIILIPGTIAWGAINAPFSAIGDLAHIGDHDKEIKVRPATANPSTQTPSRSPSPLPSGSTERNPPDGI